jgi:DNA-binding NarL/FixJ family response regulator
MQEFAALARAGHTTVDFGLELLESHRRDMQMQIEAFERELEVLRLHAEGYKNKAIAAQLVLAEGTVKNYVSTILDKLHAANRTHATQIARKQGLIE